MNSEQQQTDSRGGDLIAIALGASVLMWAAAYVGLSPAVNVPGIAMAGLVLLCLLAAGGVVGALTKRSLSGGVKLGLWLGFINFLIVASLHGRESTGEALRFGAKWILGSTIVAVALTLLGAAIGMRFRRTSLAPIRWTSWLAMIVAVTVLPLLISGGIVTGLEAGLAVPDWLTTFDYPMMFYPMAEMQRMPGVYAEHFHRLWGLLVGLSVILLAMQLHRTDSRAWLRWLSIIIVLAVIVQGVLGAIWVIKGYEASTVEAMTEAQRRLLRYFAVGHGIFGQLVFASIVSVAAFTSATWLSNRPASAKLGASTDRSASAVLFILLVLQLALGALYRHLRREAGDPMEALAVLWMHIGLATIIIVAGVLAGGRAWGVHGDQPVLPRLGGAILTLLGAQVLLGVAALLVVLHRGRSETIPPLEVVVTTAHQATGALLLATAALLVVWSRRLLSPAPERGG